MIVLVFLGVLSTGVQKGNMSQNIKLTNRKQRGIYNYPFNVGVKMNSVCRRWLTLEAPQLTENKSKSNITLNDLSCRISR